MSQRSKEEKAYRSVDILGGGLILFAEVRCYRGHRASDTVLTSYATGQPPQVFADAGEELSCQLPLDLGGAWVFVDVVWTRSAWFCGLSHSLRECPPNLTSSFLGRLCFMAGTNDDEGAKVQFSINVDDAKRK